MTTPAENRVHEYKSLLLLAIVLGAALAGGAVALWREGSAETPPENVIQKLDDGTTMVQSNGAAIRIREFSSGLVLVNRFVSPEDEELVRNVRKALRDDAPAAKYELTPFQKAQVRGLNMQTPSAPSSAQRELISQAWLGYSSAARAEAQTLPASAPATRRAELTIRKANAEAKLFAAVGQLDGDERSLPIKTSRLKRIVSPAQFDLLIGKEPAGASQPASTRR